MSTEERDVYFAKAFSSAAYFVLRVVFELDIDLTVRLHELRAQSSLLFGRFLNCFLDKNSYFCQTIDFQFGFQSFLLYHVFINIF